MNKFVRKSKTAGLAPGSLVYTGEHHEVELDLSLISYTERDWQLHDKISIEEALRLETPDYTDWLNVNGLQHTEAIERIGNHYGLHPLTVEDIVSTGQRPKVEFFDDYVFIVLRMLSLDESGKGIRDEQVSLILRPNLVLSFQETREDIFDPIRLRLQHGKGRIRKFGADYLLYALIDMVVDTYFGILERFGEAIEDLEEELIDTPTRETLGEINRYKREMIFLRKAIWPLREVISACTREESPLFSPLTVTHLRDVYDHSIQVMDTVESFREILSSMLDIYLSSIANKTNEIMKLLTLVSSIFIPLTFIAGVYGMNFELMPELTWRYGYLGVWVLMILTTAGMVAYFRYRKWL